MFTVVDQAGRSVMLSSVPKRIVSLVPSQTELLYYLGLEDEVVGITKFCVHPKSWFNTKTRVGGTKTVHIEEVRALQPDLILANKEENVKEQVEILAGIAPVWVSDVQTLDDALQMITAVGALVGKDAEAGVLAREIKARFIRLCSDEPLPLVHESKPLIAYLIWRHPYITAGGDTFISRMIKIAGFANAFENEQRYPQITLDDIAGHGSRYIFLSSEPYPFKPGHAEEIQKALPGIKIVFVDGELFSWYGSRLLLAAQYLQELKQKLSGTGAGGTYPA